jgi:hypothetical protein
VLPVCEATVLAVLINALSLQSDADPGTARLNASAQAALTRFAETMEQCVCGSSYVRPIQGAGRADRLVVRAGIMHSAVLLRCKLRRHFGGVALHNSALRIIGDDALHLHEQMGLRVIVQWRCVMKEYRHAVACQLIDDDDLIGIDSSQAVWR